jgi:Lrp/AsnC family leucine-responsive transcriptional regulator
MCLPISAQSTHSGATNCWNHDIMQQKIADAADRRILKALIADARISNAELAERAGLSPSPCLRRVRRMEEAGIIRGYTARVDPAIEGWTMSAILIIRLSRQHEDEIVMFEDAVRGWDEVMECHLVAGSPDYVLKVMSSGLDSYERFIKEKVARLKCVASIETNFVMSTIKERRV